MNRIPAAAGSGADVFAEDPRRDVPWAVLILLGALALRLYGMTGDMRFDPIVYAQYAYNLVQGDFTLETDSWFAQRLTVFAPVAPIYALFGVGTVSSIVWPLAVSLAQIGFVLYLGQRLLGRAPAILAAVLISLAPLDVIYSTVLNPDILIAAFLTGAASSWILAFERASPSRAWLFTSGVCFALAFFAREFAVVLLPFYLGHLLWRRPALSLLIWPVLGALVVTAPVAVAYQVQTGDLLYRFGVVMHRYGTDAKAEAAELLYYPKLLVHARYAWTGLFPHLIAVGILGAIVRPTRARGPLLLWILPILLYLEFGTMSFREYIPILKRDRFLLPLSAPGALLAASILLEAASGLARRIFSGARPVASRRFAAVAVTGGCLVFAIHAGWLVARARAEGNQVHDSFQRVVALVRDDHLPVLFDHWRTGYRFSYYLGFEEGASFYRGGDDAERMGTAGSFGDSRLGYLRWFPDAESLPEAYVVLDDEVLESVQRGDSVTQTYRPGDVPAYAFSPPPAWTPLGRFGDFRVYRTPSSGEANPASP